MYKTSIMALIKCEGCGNLISEHAASCPKCGHPVGNSMATVPPSNLQTHYNTPKSKTTAALLALFLGGIGVHYFYLGKTMAGLIFLLLFWTYIPALIALVQAIMMFTMTEEQFYEKYVNNPSKMPLF